MAERKSPPAKKAPGNKPRPGQVPSEMDAMWKRVQSAFNVIQPDSVRDFLVQRPVLATALLEARRKAMAEFNSKSQPDLKLSEDEPELVVWAKKADWSAEAAVERLETLSTWLRERGITNVLVNVRRR